MSAQLLPQLLPQPASAPLPHRTIAVAAGDGIGPEITQAVLDVLRAADPALSFAPVTVGLEAYRAGHAAGFDRDTIDAIAEHGVILKGPITTPQGGGYKSVNVSLRKTFGLYANLRPCVAYHPFVATHHPGMDVVIVRENEEDTYAGIEHRQTDEVVQCLKLVSRPGCERIVRYAFDYARLHGRRKVTCMTKDNIMKLTDGLFHRVFDEVAREYPDIAAEHMIIDIGTAKMAVDPTRFDVVVTPNLYGDILSDVAAEVAGSIGLAPSANIGRECAMFEAVHGSAPDIAGRDIANPSGLLLSAVMMLVHLGRGAAATAIHNAWLRTIEDGLHTADIHGAHSRERVGTRAFAQAVVARLGERPQRMAAVDYPAHETSTPMCAADIPTTRATKALDGVDVFLDWSADGRDPDALGAALDRLAGPQFRLALITNRGVKVYPQGQRQTTRTDHWRCRFVAADHALRPAAICALLLRIAEAGFEPIKTENLYTFDGERGYSQAQGE
ncbi:NADP-dependent isocitrate dehydrogenase [Cognatilysobacter lacus]|uniref:Isocitrate dehydrogenase [NADP] n=1 Tax=Cognatilysobacter lacus TaxID=1643323 RepID=A0A5D8YWG8_9GAMM|nr:NADP-dependent isocitrate dehydrogenase [Lysobacter lacus]TZF87048.1 NADP-dependent isocitrate dehydrogenase [Lysobacter lacus]